MFPLFIRLSSSYFPDYMPGEPWLASRSLTPRWDWHETTKWRTIRVNTSTMRRILPVMAPQYWVTISPIILHIWSGWDWVRAESAVRTAENVITWRRSDKKADDLAQWAPYILWSISLRRKMWNLYRNSQCLNHSCRWLLKGIQKIAWSPVSNDGPGGWNHVWSFDHVSNTVITPRITALE